MTSLHVLFEWIITHLRVICFAIILVLLLIHPFCLTLVLLLRRPIPSLILPMHHPYTSRYQIIFLHCLVIVIMFTLGTLRAMAHEIFCTCCISYMRAWVLIIGYLSLVFLHFYYPITLAYITSCVLRPPWGYGIRCRLQQPLLRLHLRLGWCLDIIMLLLLGDASLMFGFVSVVDLDYQDCAFDDGWFDVTWLFQSTTHLMPY